MNEFDKINEERELQLIEFSSLIDLFDKKCSQKCSSKEFLQIMKAIESKYSIKKNIFCIRKHKIKNEHIFDYICRNFALKNALILIEELEDSSRLIMHIIAYNDSIAIKISDILNRYIHFIADLLLFCKSKAQYLIIRENLRKAELLR